MRAILATGPLQDSIQSEVLTEIQRHASPELRAELQLPLLETLKGYFAASGGAGFNNFLQLEPQQTPEDFQGSASLGPFGTQGPCNRSVHIRSTRAPPPPPQIQKK